MGWGARAKKSHVLRIWENEGKKESLVIVYGEEIMGKYLDKMGKMGNKPEIKK